MKYKASILNVAAGLFLAWVIIYTIFNYAELSREEGWGVVAMIALFGIGSCLIGNWFYNSMVLRTKRQ